jgi:hypothetical protein
MIKLWLPRIAIGLLAAFIVLYGGDMAVYKLRGSPTGQVTVNQYQTVPLKGHKIEYDYIGTATVDCSVSLFPQAGQQACWRLRRNPNQTTEL